MPADYSSTAQALALSPSLNSPAHDSSDRPPWSRSRAGSSRRLSTATNRPRKKFLARIYDTLEFVGLTLLRSFLLLTPLQRSLVVVALLCMFAISIAILVYSHALFAILGAKAKAWRELSAGWVLVWLLTFATAFPPMIGYSTATTIAGFVYGFPLGWPIVATASTAGSLAAFVTSRTIFSGYVHKLVGKDRRFVALAQVLRREGLGMLTMIRFCPLPFSISNGFLATVPSIRPWSFAVSTALASPKLLVHVFIGSRLSMLAEEGDKMSAGDKAINYISMIVGGILGITVGWLIYRRTMARAAEIAREEAGEAAASSPRPSGDDAQYADMEAGLLGPEDAVALGVDDDDISLWEATDNEEGYRDEDSGSGEANGDGSGLVGGRGSGTRKSDSYR